MNVEALKQAVCDRVDALAPRLVHASRAIHANPELGYEEHFAHDLLAGLEPSWMSFALLQGLVALRLALGMGKPWWWLALHLAFVPMVVKKSRPVRCPLMSTNQ